MNELFTTGTRAFTWLMFIGIMSSVIWLLVCSIVQAVSSRWEDKALNAMFPGFVICVLFAMLGVVGLVAISLLRVAYKT